MSYQNVTKGQIGTAVANKIAAILATYPTGVLTEAQAEALTIEITQGVYEEACKTVNPDKTYPPVRF